MTDAVVGKWIFDEIMQGDWVYHENIVYEILDKFGDDFVYYNENGNLAIGKGVLKEFNKLKKQLPTGEIIWDRSERAWTYDR